MIYRQRHIHSEIKKHLEKTEYAILIGARQTGKTVLIRELFKELKERALRVYYLTFENIEVLKEVNKHPENIFKFTERPANPLDNDSEEKERIYIIIDEVQYADDPSGFLKYMYDTYLENLKIIATGSSAFYIDKKFKDSLAGRKHIFKLNRLNFIEFLEFKDRNDLSEELYISRKRVDYISIKKREILQFFDEFLVFGGYPAVVLEPDKEYKKHRLMEIRDSYIKRDVMEADIRNETDFFNLMSVLADQTGNLLNRNELSNTLGIHTNTLNNYIYVLEKCFHIDLINPFHKNVRKEITKMPKVYYQDTGLRNTMLNRFQPVDNRADKGALLENYVYLRLKEMAWPDQIRYWRTSEGHEIDFVITSDLYTGEAFDVKFGLFERNKYPYAKFSRVYPDIHLMGINYQQAAFL